MTVSSVGTPALTAQTASNTPSVTAAWGASQARTAGNLLVAVVGGYGTTTSAVPAAPSGWTLWNSLFCQTAATGAQTTTTFVAYYVKTAAGSDAPPVFAATFTGTAADANLAAVLFELTDSGGSTPVLWTDGKGNLPVASATSIFTGPVPAGSLGIAFAQISQGTTTATTTWTAPATGSWNACTTNQVATGFSQLGVFWTSAAPTTGQCMPAVITHGRTATFSPSIALAVAPPSSTGVRQFQASPYQAPTTSVATLTSHAFTPQAGELIVASVGFGNGNGINATSMTMTDSGGGGAGTWRQLVRQAGSGTTNSGDASVNCKDISASASMTVTCTSGPSTVMDPVMAVYRMAGAAAAASQNGGTAKTNALTVTVTPAKTGSVIIGASGEDGATALAPNAASIGYISTTGGSGDRLNLYTALAYTVATVGQTVGWSTGGASTTGNAAAEIIPAASALAATAGLATGAGTAQQTAVALEANAGLATGTSTAQPGAIALFSPAGSVIQTITASLTTAPAAAGNGILVSVITASTTVWATSISGGNYTWAQVGSRFTGSTNADTCILFLGTATAPGSSTATITFNGTQPTTRVLGVPFASTASAWALDGAQGNLDATAATMPSLTPAGPGDMYFFFGDMG